MSRLPRVAVGAVQSEADPRCLLWALYEVLERRGTHVQAFLSRACFVPLDGAGAVTGQSCRHLDSWLMAPDVCREIFYQGARAADVAIVDGPFFSTSSGGATASDLETLCDWLDLPRVAVVDVSRWDDCRLPRKPARLDAVFLDRVRGLHQATRCQTALEATWGVPVLGWLGEMGSVRDEMARLPGGGRPPRELCHALGRRFEPRFQLSRFLDLAAGRDFAPVPSRLYRRSSQGSGPNVAVAFDEAFGCYFPDTLDLLELNGATIRTFSPLRDEQLPPGTDLVYIGCGHPERYAEALSGNHCLKQSLRGHVCRGGRLYAEGGGLAYLCRQIALADGRVVPMVGVFPAVARRASAAGPRPVEVTLREDCWLGEARRSLRGYLNTAWQLEPAEELRGLVADEAGRFDLVARRNAVGSRLHLNFAAQPDFLPSFWAPQAAPRILSPAR
jgi:cobyrinic acid a,c-diamide synthase